MATLVARIAVGASARIDAGGVFPPGWLQCGESEVGVTKKIPEKSEANGEMTLVGVLVHLLGVVIVAIIITLALGGHI